MPPTDQREFKALILDWNQVSFLIHGLAYVKVFAEKSKVSENYDNWFGWEPTSLGYGENILHAALKRWIAEEEINLWNSFKAACDTGSDAAHKWLVGANKARGMYYSNIQETIERLNYTNARVASRLAFSARTGAIVQFAAEVSLVWLGVVGGGGILCVNNFLTRAGVWSCTMTIKLGLKKAAIGGLSALLISVAESVSAAEKPDLIAAPAMATLTNIPGALADLSQDIMRYLNDRNMKKIMDAIERNKASSKAAREAMKGVKPADPAYTGLKAARDAASTEGNALAQQLGNARRGLAGMNKLTAAGSFTVNVLSWGLAGVSTFQSGQKLAKHLYLEN